MKKILFLLFFILFVNVGYSQITISRREFSVTRGDTLVWLDTFKSLILCHNKGKRESLFSIKTEHKFNVDTLKFRVSKSDVSLEKSGLLVNANSSYFSFIDIDIMGSYLHIFKKHKKGLFHKEKWQEEAAIVLPPLKSRLSGFHVDSNVNILGTAYLLDIFTAKVICTNGNIFTYTYDEKSKEFNKKSN